MSERTVTILKKHMSIKIIQGLGRSSAKRIAYIRIDSNSNEKGLIAQEKKEKKRKKEKKKNMTGEDLEAHSLFFLVSPEQLLITPQKRMHIYNRIVKYFCHSQVRHRKL